MRLLIRVQLLFTERAGCDNEGVAAVRHAPAVGGRVGKNGRFELLGELGRGAMGVVYEALDREQHAVFALKSLPTFDAEALLLFKNEFRSLQDIHHPNLVRLGELFEDGGNWFFTMELVRGVSFVHYVRGGSSVERSGVRLEAAAVAADDATVVDPSSRARTKTAAAPGVASREHSPPFDEIRLRSVLEQVARGLLALHGQQKIHRDIKPSNVLVDRDGQVKIIDFGLVTERSTSADVARFVVGTPLYMAPEQAMGAAAGPAADWYSVGVMTYVALTGGPPHEGDSEMVRGLKVAVEPVPASARTERAVPRDLDELTNDLLRIEPEQRLTGTGLLRRLGVNGSVPPSARPRAAAADANGSDDARFVGRRAELDLCNRAFGDAARGHLTLRVTGESGVGKSALARQFCDQLRRNDPRAIVLRGRCYERESVPFKAVDGVIDALSEALEALPPEEIADLLPPETWLIAQTFPVLRRIPLADELSRASQERMTPDARRSRLFSALRDLFERIAASRRIAIVIDDLQWSDADSLALLRSVLEPPNAPPIFLLVTMRTVSQMLSMEGRTLDVTLPGEVRDVSMQGLPAADAQELAAELLREMGDVSGRAESIAAEAAGHPLFIDELVRASRSSDRPRLEDALASRVKALDPRARHLLDVVTIAGSPIALAAAGTAVGLPLAALNDSIALLRAAHLVRTTGTGSDDLVEPYHDRVRSAVLVQLGTDTGSLHRKLAEALESTGRGEPETLASLWREAGESGRAARYAVAAAQRAMSLLAFHRATQLYRMAVELVGDVPKERSALRAQLGDALVFAGRCEEAAEAYEEAAGECETSDEALELRRRGAQQLLANGLMDRGTEKMRGVLEEIGMSLPESLVAAAGSMLYRRAQVRLRGLAFEPKRVTDVSPDLLRRIDTCWAAVIGLGFSDLIRGADFQSRHLLLALRAGEPLRICRALSAEAMYVAADGGSAKKRTLAIIGSLDALVAQLGAPSGMRALADAAKASAMYLLGEFADVPRLMNDALGIVGQEWTESTRFEIDNCRIFWLRTLSWRGDLNECRRQCRTLLEEGIGRQNVHIMTQTRGTELAFRLADDDPGAALEKLNTMLDRWSDRPEDWWNHPAKHVYFPHVFNAFGRAHVELYRDNPLAAYECITRARKRLTRNFVLEIAFMRVHILNAHGMATLALAAAAPKRRRALLVEAEGIADRLENDAMAWSVSLSALTRAAIAFMRGEDALCRAHLEHAIELFDQTAMALHAAVARMRLADLVGGDEGQALRASASAWMNQEGVREPERFANVYAPGFVR